MMKRDHIKQINIAQLFNEAVVRYGDLTCQLWKPTPDTIASLTYSEVYWKVKDLCCGLMAIGVEKSDRVCLMAANCPQWLWADFAILCAGAVTTTIYPTSSAREMNYIVNDSGAKMIFVRDQKGLDKVISKRDEMLALRTVIVMEDLELPDDPAFFKMDDLILLGRKYYAQHPLSYEKRWHSVDIFDWCTIVYTSGTTGEPKGALHTHHSIAGANVLDYRLFAKNEYDFNENHVMLNFLPLAHTYERQYGQFIAIDKGVTIAYCQNPSTLMEDFRSFRPHYMTAVPRIFERMWMAIRKQYDASPEGKALFKKAIEIGLKVIDFHTDENGFIDMSWDKDYTEGLSAELKEQFLQADQEVFSKAREMLGGRFIVAVSASASLNPYLVRVFLAMGIRIDEGYGLTETCNTTTYNNMKKVLPGSIGPLGPGVEGRLAEDGELEVRGANIFLEYYNKPNATAEAFTEDGFFRTGDIARFGPDDYVYIIDRKKGLVVLDTGKKVPRGKVESQFATSEVVQQVCVAGDAKPYLTALIVPKYDFFINYFLSNRIAFDESQLLFEGTGKDRTCIQVGEDFIRKQELKDLVAKDIAEKNVNLEHHEAIKDFFILNRQFSVDLDELTPTFKNKYRNILSNFAEEVEAIY